MVPSLFLLKLETILVLFEDNMKLNSICVIYSPADNLLSSKYVCNNSGRKNVAVSKFEITIIVIKILTTNGGFNMLPLCLQGAKQAHILCCICTLAADCLWCLDCRLL